MEIRLRKNNYPLVLFISLGFIFLISSCKKDEAPVIEYPTIGFYGDNILLKTQTDYTKQENSLAAKIPQSKKVTIIITRKIALLPTGLWYYEPASNNNWVVTDFDYATNSQAFSSINSGLTYDLRMNFDPGTYQIDYYEDNSLSPTITKTIRVNY